MKEISTEKKKRICWELCIEHTQSSLKEENFNCLIVDALVYGKILHVIKQISNMSYRIKINEGYVSIKNEAICTKQSLQRPLVQYTFERLH